MKCTFCGSRIDANDGFCSNCGTPVKGMAIPSFGGENTGAVSHGDSNGQSTMNNSNNYQSYGNNMPEHDNNRNQSYGGTSEYGNRNNRNQSYGNTNGYGNRNGGNQSYGGTAGYGNRNSGSQEYSNNTAFGNQTSNVQSGSMPGYGSRNNNYASDQFLMGQQGFGTLQRKQKRTGGGTIVAIIMLFILFIGAGSYFTVFRDARVKTVKGTGYSIDMSATMKKTTDKATVTTLDAYANSKMTFVLEKIDYTDLQLLGYGAGMSSQDMFNLLDKYNVSSAITFTKCDCTYLYFTQNTMGKNLSGICRMVEGNGGYYFFEFGCESSNKSKYESKFKKWLNTAKLT